MKMNKNPMTHKQKVSLLYKMILRLHKRLPPEMKSLGDNYAKEEFKRHKDSSTQHANTFLSEWANYATIMAQQIKLEDKREVGQPFSEKYIENFSEDQLMNLYKLYQETKR